MLRRLTKFGESVLKKSTKEIESFDQSLKDLANDLVETLYEENGLGLAAPQIDVQKRVFAIDMRRRSDDSVPCEFTIDGKTLPLDIAMPIVAVNPVIEEIGEFIETAEEGCLSFPGIFAEVDRCDVVRLTYFDTEGVQHVLVCSGLFARCVQHENDHLNGICFVDRLSQRQLFKIESKLKKLRRKTRDFLKSQGAK